MTYFSNPQRPTSTATLWGIGLEGGIIVAVAIFLGGDGDTNDSRALATAVGVWSSRLLFLGGLLAGGWNVLRRKSDRS